MSIPKGLILYKALRYQEDYPVSLKYGCYSNTIRLATEKNQSRMMRKKHKRKMLRDLYFNIQEDFLRYNEILKINPRFPKSNAIRRCFISSGLCWETLKETEALAIKVIRRIFRTLKYLEEVKMSNLGSLQKNAKFFKILLLQRSLQSLTLDPLEYSEDYLSLEIFIKFSQLVGRRIYWPHLKSLVIDPFYQRKRDYCAEEGLRSFKNLLKFLKDFKSCENLEKCSHFQSIFPLFPLAKILDAELKKKIIELQIPALLVHLYSRELAYFPESSKFFHDLKKLKSISIETSYSPQEYIDKPEMIALRDILNLQNIILTIEDESRLPFYKSLLKQIGNLTGLVSLHVAFDEGKVKILNELGFEVCKALSNLCELRDLTLDTYFAIRENRDIRLMNCPWFEDAFKIIGKKKKLKTLTLIWVDFSFENSRNIFHALCQCIKELSQLSSLKLELRSAPFIEDKDISTLANSMRSLKKIEDLKIDIKKNTGFNSNAFVDLMSHIMKSFPNLSNLDLSFEKFKMTTECSQVISEAIHKMKCLNQMTIFMEGEIEEGLNMTHLSGEIRKRMAGSIEYYVSRYV